MEKGVFSQYHIMWKKGAFNQSSNESSMAVKMSSHQLGVVFGEHDVRPNYLTSWMNFSNKTRVDLVIDFKWGYGTLHSLIARRGKLNLAL